MIGPAELEDIRLDLEAEEQERRARTEANAPGRKTSRSIEPAPKEPLDAIQQATASMPIMLVLRTLRALRLTGWLCVAALVWLSWIPREHEVRTGLRGEIEHAIAYCGAAAIFAFAYHMAPRWRLAAAFTLLAAVLEAGQLWAPGRTPQLVGFLSSSLGAIGGVFIGRAAITWVVNFVLRYER